jgi:hypothetical protein
MPSWILDPTIFGGFAPFGVLHRLVNLRTLIFEASDFLVTSDEMADGHRFWPGRSGRVWKGGCGQPGPGPRPWPARGRL